MQMRRRLPPPPRPASRAPAEGRGRPASPLEGELLDLYEAMLIVVPLALLLNSLWT